MESLTNFLQHLLYLIFLIFKLSCIPSSGTFTVQGPLDQRLQAWVGGEVLFSCLLSPKMDVQQMTVKWVRGPEVVHLYLRGKEVEEIQAPAFQGRTKMLRQDMAEGKVTVSIQRVQLSDAGQYTCCVWAGTSYSEASFDFRVEEPPFSVTAPAQIIQAKQGEDVTLSCEFSPKVDVRNMTVKWFRNQTLLHSHPSGEKLQESQGEEFQGRTQLLKHDLAEGKVLLRIQQVQGSDSGPYICHVHAHDYHSEAHIKLWVADCCVQLKKSTSSSTVQHRARTHQLFPEAPSSSQSPSRGSPSSRKTKAGTFLQSQGLS